MEPEGLPALLEALFVYRKTYILEKDTKASLRLCNKHFKNLVDATVVEAKKYSDDLNLYLNTVLNTECHGLETFKSWREALIKTAKQSCRLLSLSNFPG